MLKMIRNRLYLERMKGNIRIGNWVLALILESLLLIILAFVVLSGLIFLVFLLSFFHRNNFYEIPYIKQ